MSLNSRSHPSLSSRSESSRLNCQVSQLPNLQLRRHASIICRFSLTSLNNMKPFTTYSWDLLQEAGKQHSVIRVRNLQTSLVVGRDAWGREGKAQPLLISASVSLREPFQSASNEDAVTGSTVHYGILSKKILETCKLFSVNPEEHSMKTLSSLAREIEHGLTRREATSSAPGSLFWELREGITPETLSNLALEIDHGLTRMEIASSAPTPTPAILPSSVVKLLEIKVMLPKASLLGEGVSLTDFSLLYDGSILKAYVLTLHDLKIPTLIGVNPNERLAKQLVVATIKIDGIERPRPSHFYHVLEQIVVKVSYCECSICTS